MTKPGPHDPPGDRPSPNDPPPTIPPELDPRREAHRPAGLYPSALYPGMLSWHAQETSVRISHGHKHLAAA